MSEDSNVDTGAPSAVTSVDHVEAPAPAPEPAPAAPPEGAQAAPEGGEAEAAQNEGGDQNQAPEAPKKKSPVAQLQGRVGHLTKTVHEKDDVIRNKDAEIEAYRRLLASSGQGDSPAPAAPTLTPPAPAGDDFDRRVNERAHAIAAEQSFTAECNRVFEQGVKDFGPEFKEAVTNLNSLGLADKTMIDAALATGEAAKVLHFLGGDTEEAERVAALNPIQRAAEMTRLAIRLAAPAARSTSAAPAPIKPIGGAAKATDDVYDPGLSMQEYAARRARAGSPWARPAKGG